MTATETPLNTRDTTLEITRMFDAPAARVFDAWLNREEWQSWIGPEGLRCEVPLLEPRVGGRYRIIMRLADGRVIPVAGIYRTVASPRTLAFTWGAEADPARHTLITLSLADNGDTTDLTLRQEGFASVGTRDTHVAGWNEALNKLEAYLTGRDAGSVAGPR
ncbi:MAG TPA: SRPBCC domain-containing protein [Steroidobacteraceae bacterium]|nr:SRPBCC domain-containing protein [Steroidobacteraceae bacterium]